jgi:D-lyxose ketol-isomerase
MKRSEINSLIAQAKSFMEQRGFALPPFAFWSAADWSKKGPECREIAEAQLGWDITDFGSGHFDQTGLLLFTIRNGVHPVRGKDYAEKIMIVREKQLTPTHFHHYKMEDIINRGGGKLVLKLWHASDDDALADTAVKVSIDGIARELPAGGLVELAPGESITLPPRLYHRFWAEGGMTLVGEVSRVNDDRTDNRFHDPVGRFPEIEEDEPPLHLLVTDYPRYYAAAK